MDRLVADIGGTNARFALAGPDGEPEVQLLFAALAQAPVLGSHPVRVPRRKAANQQIMLPARTALLEVRVQAVHLRPRGQGAVPTAAWVIQATEVDPPAGEPPIHWLLITTAAVPSPCATPADPRWLLSGRGAAW